MQITYRKAEETEAAALTKIGLLSKQYWQDTKEYLPVFEKELTITPYYIRRNAVFIIETIETKTPVGYFSITEIPHDLQSATALIPHGFWLEHFYILPEHIKKGVGRQAISFLKSYCKQYGIPFLYLFSDPHAKGFYDKMGAVYLENSFSPIEGRRVPLYRLYME